MLHGVDRCLFLGSHDAALELKKVVICQVHSIQDVDFVGLHRVVFGCNILSPRKCQFPSRLITSGCASAVDLLHRSIMDSMRVGGS